MLVCPADLKDKASKILQKPTTLIENYEKRISIFNFRKLNYEIKLYGSSKYLFWYPDVVAILKYHGNPR